MKKFLTVLLALSVVFTYTVGSAFALPSDSGTEAGLAAAKAEAVKELEAYPTMSDYDATGQAKVKAIIAEYTDKINDATKVGTSTDGVAQDSVYGYLNEGKRLIDQVAKATELEDAKKAAVAQFNDYVYLIDTLDVPVTDKAVKDAKVGYQNYDSFKTAARAAINGATSVADVDKARNLFTEKADAIYANLEYVEVPQEKIDALVKEIRVKAASYSVNTKTHSKSVVNAFEAAIESGVSAAKAVKTYEDYFKVIDKYLGAAASKAEAKFDNVYVHVKQLSAFEKLANRTKDVERQIKAVEKVLAILGDYDYKKVAASNWAEAEKFYAEAKYFVENGVFDTLKKKVAPDTSTPALRALYFLINGDKWGVDADDVTTEFNQKIDNVVAAYNKLAPVEVSKKDLAERLKGYTTGKSYSEANATAIKAFKATGVNLINAAATVKAAEAVFDEYKAKIDAVDSVDEEAFKATIKKYNNAVDEYVATYKGVNALLTADQEVLLARFVKDLKEQYVENEQAETDFSMKNISTAKKGSTTLGTVAATGVAYSADAAAAAGYVVKATADYNARNAGLVEGVVNEFNNETLNKIKTWAEFFTAYDKAMAEIDVIQTAVQENYVNAIDAVDAAVAALGTPALTAEFKTKLAKADSAMAAYNAAKEEFDKLDDDEKAEITKTLDKTAYDAAKLEYDRLVYLEGLKDKAASPIKEVNDFTAIANDFLTVVNNLFSVDAKAEIAKIVTDTYAAINAAGTDAAKAAEAVKGIEKLDAVAVDGSGAAADLADLLARIKSEAAEYFTKYENAAFTSNATTKIDLVKDIIAFNAQFSDTAAQDKANRIKAVKAIKVVKNHSVAGKGYIKISWSAVGDTSAIDGYRVYRSTKANSGYKYIFKTTKQSYKNTKSLKKGTRYYYKVRAYADIDGQRYFSDYSNKAYRYAK